MVTRAPAGGQPGTNAGAAVTTIAGRFYDVNLELRGTVGLATVPDEKIVGLEPGQADVPAAEDGGEKPAAVPPAAAENPAGGRRIAS